MELKHIRCFGHTLNSYKINKQLKLIQKRMNLSITIFLYMNSVVVFAYTIKSVYRPTFSINCISEYLNGKYKAYVLTHKVKWTVKKNNSIYERIWTNFVSYVYQIIGKIAERREKLIDDYATNVEDTESEREQREWKRCYICSSGKSNIWHT